MDKLVQYKLTKVNTSIDGAFEARAKMKDKVVTRGDKYRMRAYVISNILCNICAKHNIDLEREFLEIREEMWKEMEIQINKLDYKEGVSREDN